MGQEQPVFSAGATRARGKYLAFTDDDCLPAPDWLQALTVRFDRPPDHLVGGRIINALPENPYSTAAQLLIDYMYARDNSDRHHANFFASNNLADTFQMMSNTFSLNRVHAR